MLGGHGGPKPETLNFVKLEKKKKKKVNSVRNSFDD
jgi:hypothetical protein